MRVDTILCVCTGNICRSPYAEGLLSRALPDVRVSSAGIGAVVGGRMPEAAAQIAARQGLSLDDHRGRQVTTPIIRENEVVLVMEQGQKQWLADRFPESRGRVFMISHWQDQQDVPDPYRHSAAFFDTVFTTLEAYCEDWIDRLASPRKSASR